MEKEYVHTLIIGSGAAGLATAVQLHRNGVQNLLIATESLEGGTSINTGSDKQTYYKLSLCGAEADSVRSMAETYFAGGSMHGDLALAEAASSVRAFMNLVELGLPFPADEFGQFVGYKTDHDPRQRATSIGPYTSREMCRAMIREVRKLCIRVKEGLFVKKLLVDYEPTDVNSPVKGTVRGAVFFVRKQYSEVKTEEPEEYDLLEVEAQNVVFAVGGPGGLYWTSVYPKVHTGAIGVALEAGALAQNLPESQFGLASIGFRWNVSGTFMQCVPRFVSTDADGVSNEKEFLEEYASEPGELLPLIFLKGYQWPFDSRKTWLQEGVVGHWGSSMIDIWTYVETVLRGRRVWIDFRCNPSGFSSEKIGDEAWNYLEKSGASTQETPIARLEKMNPAAIQLYAEHGIDLRAEKLEVAVCAQHCNGGLAADVNWESVNIHRLFPVGEVNGSHGVYRPGGSALNSGQVGAIRAAKIIAERAKKTDSNWERKAQIYLSDFVISSYHERGKRGATWKSSVPLEDWKGPRAELQRRMTRAGSFLRQLEAVHRAIPEAHLQRELQETKNLEKIRKLDEMETQRNHYLLLTQELYLDAIRFQLESGVGSRGSAIVLRSAEKKLNREDALGTSEEILEETSEETLEETSEETSKEILEETSEICGVLEMDLNGQRVSIVPEDERFRALVQESWILPDGTLHHRWVPRREIPEPDSWFENVWRQNRKLES